MIKKGTLFYAEDVPELITNLFKESKNTILDLGAGYGTTLYALHKRGLLDKVKRIVAIEISPNRIDKIKELNLNIECIVCDATNLFMLEDNSIDVILSNQVIEHIKDEDAFLEEAYRVLSKNGRFYLSTVFKKWYGWFFYRCNGKWTLEPTHLREYTNEKQLLDKVEKIFEVVINKKSLLWLIIIDYVLKILGIKGYVSDRFRWLSFLRKIKFPLIGYYNWELILRKN